MRYLLFLALFAFPSFSALAEEHEGEVEKIEVIGSHIKRISTEGPSPVLVIDREQIEMSGYNSLSDVLRDLPVASLGGVRETALAYPTSQTTTSLRGMSSKDILVLLNYRRLPPVGGTNSVDFSIIPLSAIDKIEILKDGASAIYGSDAVGGVINIVTKKGDVGGQVNVQGSLVQREEGNNFNALGSFFDFWNWNAEDENNAWNGKGDKLSIDASYGGSTGNTSYLVGGQVRFNSNMYLKDRKFAALKKPTDGSNYSSPGSWLNGDKYELFPGCPSERIKNEKDKDGKDKGQRCKWDYTPYMQAMPRVLQGSVFAQANTEIDSSLYASATGVYSYINSFSVLAPAPFVELARGAGVPAETARKWGVNVPEGVKTVKVFYRPVNEKGAGQRKFNLNNHSYQIQANITKELSDTMELDGNLNFSGSHYFTDSKGFIQLKKLLKLTNQAKFNPLLPEDQKGDLSEANHEPQKETHSNLLSFEPKLSGKITETDDMSLFFAVGGLGAWQTYLEEFDEISKSIEQDENDKILGGDVAVDGEGDRLFGSAYGELSLFAFDIFELQLASRTDYYYYSASDSASGFTEQTMPFTEDISMPISPRVAFYAQPVNEVKFRASWNMGFRAPSLVDIHQNETTTHPFSINYIKCPEASFKRDKKGKSKSGCEYTQHTATISGNTDLKPETFQSVNLGLILQPIEKLSLIVDYFITHRENLITSTENLRDILKHAEKKGIKEVEKYGQKLEMNATGDIEKIHIKPFNNAYDFSHGFDLELGIMPISLLAGWDLGFNLEHHHIMYNEYQAFDDSDVEVPIPNYWDDNILTWPERPRWRNRAILSVMNKDMGHIVQLIVHNIPGQKKSAVSSDNKVIDYYWQLDLAGRFTLNKQTSLTLGIQNVLGFDRPENADRQGSTGYLASTLYSIRGRTLNARFTYNFQ